MLIVESVEADGAGEQAGIHAEDRLLSYAGQPLLSPAMLQALEENTFGQATLSLRLQRNGETLDLTVPPGTLGVKVRPEMSPDLLAAYEAARTAFMAGEHTEAAKRWQQVATQASDDRTATWLWGKAGASWEKVADWQQALAAYNAVWEGLTSSEDGAARSTTAVALGRCHQNRSDWEKAVLWYERADQTDCQAKREIWAARNVNNLGVVALLRGDLQAAQDYHIRALIIEERLAPNSLDVATSLNNLGMVAWKHGNFSAAWDYHTRAVAIQEHLAPGSLDLAAFLNNLGNVAWSRGDLSAAQDCYTRALTIIEHLAPGSLDAADSLGNLGIVAANRGYFEAAWDYLTRALTIREHLAPGSLTVASSLNNLGALAYDRGDLSAAWDYFARALTIQERLALDSLVVASSLNNLGSVASKRGDLSVAWDYHTRALTIQERLAPDSLVVAHHINNLGSVAYRRGDLSVAWDYYARALTIKERLAPDSLDVTISLNNLGSVALSRGDLSAAQDYYTRALTIIERLAPDSLDVAGSLNNLGLVALDRGNLQTAQNYHTRALQVHERLAPNSLDCAEALTQLGLTLLMQNQPKRALPRLQQAVEILEQQRSAIVSADARALLVAQHTTQYAALIQGYHALDQHELAFSTLERSRARSLMELLAERRLDFAGQAPPALLHQQKELDEQRAHAYNRLAKLSATAEAEPQIQALHAELRDIERTQQQLADQIRQTSPHFASLQYPQPLDCKAAQAQLQPGTLLLSYLVDEEQIFLFALTHNTVEAFTLPLGRAALQERVKTFRTTLDRGRVKNRSRRATARAIRLGRQLYADLVAPAFIGQHRPTRLLVCPDGPLHTLPFSALVINRRGHPHYLGQSTPLATILSMTLLAQTRETAWDEPAMSHADAASTSQAAVEEPRTSVPSLRERVSTTLNSARRLLALGDPVYPKTSPVLASIRSVARAAVAPRASKQGKARQQEREAASQHLPPTSSPIATELDTLRTRGLNLGPLPYTREEVNAIQRLFGEHAQVKLGPDATKSAVLQLGPTAELLHLACHGFLDDRNPLSSGLVLSLPEALEGTATEGDNGLLQAWEIFSHLRLKADMVVLSACQSGLGQEVRGEGLVGLTRAFLYAGAKSLLVSLWEVEDLATAMLMGRFYHYLLEVRADGSRWDRDTALSAAQRDVREMTVETVLSEWLTGDRIEGLANGNGKLERELNRQAKEFRELQKSAPGSCPFAAPYYWAGFVFQGEAGPLPDTAQP